MDEFSIAMGVEVRDTITGFKGVVIGRSQYITGCNQYLVASPSKANKLSEAEWFDEDRLKRTKKKSKVKIKVRRKRGGPRSNEAPKK